MRIRRRLRLREHQAPGPHRSRSRRGNHELAEYLEKPLLLPASVYAGYNSTIRHPVDPHGHRIKSAGRLQLEPVAS